MKNLYKSLRGCLCILLLFVLCSTTATAKIKIPNSTGEFANDFANLLSTDTKQHINSTSQRYSDSTGNQVVVVTVPTLNGASIEEYTLELGRKWGVGQKDKNDGVVILLALTEREVRVEVGYGLEATITDSMSGRFIEAVSPYLKEDDFDTGLRQLYDLVIAELESPGSYEETYVSSNDNSSGISIFAVIIILVLIILSSGGGRGRGRRGGGFFGGPFHGGGFGGGGFGGGGFSGGGSSGGGFSGGGGSFGGGGSSGKF